MFSSKLRNMFTNILQPLKKGCINLASAGGTITHAIYQNKTVTLSRQQLL